MDENALRRLLAMGYRPEDLGLSTDPMTGDVREPEPSQNVLAQMMREAGAKGQDVLVAPQTYGMGGNAKAEVNGDFKVYAGEGRPTDRTLDVQAVQRQRMAQPQGPRGGPMRVVGAGGGSTVELSPEVAPASVDIDYSRPPVDVPGVGKVYYDKSGMGAYALDGSGRPTTKVYLGYNDAGSRARNKENLAMDATRANIEHTQAQTAQVGAPNYQITPDGTVFNPKTGTVSPANVLSSQVERKRQEAAYSSGLKELQHDEQQVGNVNQLEQAYKRWAELNAKVMTGRISGMADPLLSISNPERQEMIQLQNYLAVNNFKPGQGQISNFERGLIKGAGPTTSNDLETNNAIVKINLGAIQNMRDRQQFREAWLNQKGSLLGADQAWQRYLDENPRYVRDHGGQIVDNQARMDWQQFFATGGSQGRPDVAPPMNTQAQAPSNIPAPAIEFLKRNPASAADFDRKYGEGSARRILGR